METRAFLLEAPFRVIADSSAHSGKAEVQAALSHSGERMVSHLSVWTNTAYLSTLCIRGAGSGTLFVASDDLSQRLAATTGTVFLPGKGIY